MIKSQGVSLPRNGLWFSLIIVALVFVLTQTAPAPLPVPFLQPGPRLILAVDQPAGRPSSPEALAAAAAVVRQRLGALGLSGPARLRMQEERLVIDLPRHTDAVRVGRVLAGVGRLEMIDTGTQFAELGSRVKTSPAAESSPPLYRTLFTEADVVASSLATTQAGELGLMLTLTPAAAARFSSQTTHRPGLYLCLALDKEVVACPIVRPLADGRSLFIGEGPVRGLITLTDLAAQLESGLLPLPLKVEAS